LDRIVTSGLGSFTIWLGRDDNSSVGNVVRGVRNGGRARGVFQPDRAMFTYMGDTTIEGGSVEGAWDAGSTYTPILAFYASGKIKMDGMFMEFPAHASGVGFMFDNAQGSVDRLYHVMPWRRLHLINGSDIQLRNLNINGMSMQLRDAISVDASSRLTLQTVNARRDSGMLDHPRVLVRGFYNEMSDYFVETASTTRGTNLIADPDFRNVTDDIRLSADWQIIWRNGWSGRAGHWSVEYVNGVPRLRVDLTEPAYFHIRVNTKVPGPAVGQTGLATWRIDGPGTPTVYTRDWISEYSARATGSLTAARTPQQLRGNDQLWIAVGSPTQPAPVGTYYFWKFGLVAT
jgi:hypothetical protein